MGMFLPMKISGKKVSPEARECSIWIENASWGIRLGRVLCGDGVGRCRMEMGDFMAPGQPALLGVRHRGAVKVFGVSLWGVWASGRGSQHSLPGRCRRFPCILNYIELWFQHSTGQDTQAVSIVSVTSAFVFWLACVVSVSPLCQAHSFGVSCFKGRASF